AARRRSRPGGLEETSGFLRQARGGADVAGLRLPRQAQDVADAGHGVDEWRAVLVDLAPQIADVRLHHAVVAAEVVLPDVVQDLSLRQDPAGVGRQEPQ